MTILYPAIDLMGGRCVRLKQGDPTQATVFADDPGAQAKTFADQGFTHLHVVDLDGAFAGKPANIEAVESILKSFSGPVQLGGGIRTLAAMEGWLEAGIDRVIIGTTAVQNPELVIEACKLFPHRIAVGLDARHGMVAVSGWAETSSLPILTVAKRFEDAGVAAIIHTDIARDGMLTGPNLQASVDLAQSISIPVIVSGGMASIEDIRRVAEVKNQGVAGAILGRALYAGKIDPVEALKLVPQNRIAAE
jgi:phosphoribosylformimino-5-aminoimidazole carboxamide ribotide isomerase